MGEKGNALEGASTAVSGGTSLVGRAGEATANVVLDTGETLRGKLVEGAAQGAVQAGRERVRRKGKGDDEPDAPEAEPGEQ
jgi:hypothetical protein